MEFVRSEKAVQKFIRNGYMYVYQKDLAGEAAIWECKLRKRSQCKARVTLDRNNAFLQDVNDHAHPLKQTKVEVVKVRASTKRRTETSLDTPQQIITGELKGILEAAAVSLPLMNSTRRNIPQQRHRSKFTNPDRAEIPVSGGQFLQYDSGIGWKNIDGRILISAFDQGLELLSNSDNWFCDSTFKVC